MGPACAAPVLSPRAATACVRRFLSPRKRHSPRRVHSSRDVVPGMKDLWCGRMRARAHWGASGTFWRTWFPALSPPHPPRPCRGTKTPPTRVHEATPARVPTGFTRNLVPVLGCRHRVPGVPAPNSERTKRCGHVALPAPGSVRAAPGGFEPCVWYRVCSRAPLPARARASTSSSGRRPTSLSIRVCRRGDARDEEAPCDPSANDRGGCHRARARGTRAVTRGNARAAHARATRARGAHARGAHARANNARANHAQGNARSKRDPLDSSDGIQRCAPWGVPKPHAAHLQGGRETHTHACVHTEGVCVPCCAQRRCARSRPRRRWSCGARRW